MAYHLHTLCSDRWYFEIQVVTLITFSLKKFTSTLKLEVLRSKCVQIVKLFSWSFSDPLLQNHWKVYKTINTSEALSYAKGYRGHHADFTSTVADMFM